MKNELISEIKTLNKKLGVINTTSELEALTLFQLQIVIANKTADLTYKLNTK